MGAIEILLAHAEAAQVLGLAATVFLLKGTIHNDLHETEEYDHRRAA